LSGVPHFWHFGAVSLSKIISLFIVHLYRLLAIKTIPGAAHQQQFHVDLIHLHALLHQPYRHPNQQSAVVRHVQIQLDCASSIHRTNPGRFRHARGDDYLSRNFRTFYSYSWLTISSRRRLDDSGFLRAQAWARLSFIRRPIFLAKAKDCDVPLEFLLHFVRPNS
jgi:hypothetical protein